MQMYFKLMNKENNKLLGLCKCGNELLEGFKNCQKCKDRSKKSFDRWRLQNKLIVLWHYSNGEVKCVCCGESNYKFLTIDHVNGNGAEHRKNITKDLGYYGGRMLYDWLIKNNFPDGFQVYCYNCNSGKLDNGECPHKSPILSKQLISNILSDRLKIKDVPNSLVGLVKIISNNK